MSLFISGCGGGGGSDLNLPKEPSNSEKAKLTDSNSKESALSSSATVISIGTGFSNLQSIIDQRRIRLLRATNEISTRAIGRSESVDCQNGGSIKASQNGTTLTGDFNHCLYNGYLLDGYIKIEGYGESVTTITYKKFTIEGSGIKFDIKYGIFKDDYTNEVSSIKKLYAKLTQNGSTLEFLNYNGTTDYKDLNSNINSFSGWIKNDCLDGYVYVKSTPKVITDNELEHFSGSFEISSNGKKVSVSFKNEDNETIVEVKDVSGSINQYTIDEFKSEMGSLDCN